MLPQPTAPLPPLSGSFAAVPGAGAAAAAWVLPPLPAAAPPPLAAGSSAAAADAGASSQLPNLLMIFPDEWRWDWAGFDPEQAMLHMPNLAALAVRSTRFTHAYTPSPWCAPARACLAAVREFDESPKSLNGRDFPLDVPTWYQALKQVGYHVISTGKDDLTQSFSGTGRDGARHAAELGFDAFYRMEDKFVTYRKRPWDQFGMSMWSTPCGLLDSNKTNLYECNDWCYGMYGRGSCCTAIAHEGYDCPGFDQVGLNQEDYLDNFIGLQSEMLLGEVPEGKPWVLHVSLPGPHPPFIITQAMNESVSGRHFAASHDNQLHDAKQQSRIRAQYSAEVENIDSIIGSLLAKVEARGETGNTLVVVTSDHGEQLGDQNAWGKKMPWEPSIRVPLVIGGPGVALGRTVAWPVSTLDVIGTFLQRAGVTVKGQQAYSLDPLMRDVDDAQEYLAARPFVPTGLSYPGFVGDPAVDFRAVVRHLNDTVTLKVICCPFGCPRGNSKVPSTAPWPQLLAFNVAAKHPHDTVDLGAMPEALELAAALPGRYATVCLPPGYEPRPLSAVLMKSALPARADGIPAPVSYAVLETPLLAAVAAALVAAAALLARRRRSRGEACLLHSDEEASAAEH